MKFNAVASLAVLSTLLTVAAALSCSGSSRPPAQQQTPTQTTPMTVAPALTPTPIPAPDARFGVHNAGPAGPGLASQIAARVAETRALGAGMLRVNILWSCTGPTHFCVERTEGAQLDWSVPDAVVRETSAAHIALLMNIRGYTCSIPNRDLMSLYKNDPAQKLAAYERFVRLFVQRYRGRIQYWQIENEVDGDGFWCGSLELYRDVLKTAHRVIKEEDPQARVILAGLTTGLPYTDIVDTRGPQTAYGRQYIATARQLASMKDSFDIVDLHAYQRTEELSARIAFFKQLFQTAGYLGPYWVTETGAPIPAADCQSGISAEPPPEVQAGEVLKRFATLFALGAERIVWHSLDGSADPGAWVCTGPNIYNFNFMTLRRGSNRRQAFTTFTLMADRLGNFQSVRRLNVAPDIDVVEFTLSPKPVYVAWSSREQSVTLPISGLLRVTDVSGNTSQVPAGQVTLKPIPVLIEGAE